VWGPPGCSKSSLVKQASQQLEIGLVDVRSTLMDPVDLRGLPTVDKKANQTRWCPPDFFPTDGEGFLFLDELAQAPPMMQAALLQLALDRKVGDYELPPGWTVIAASNNANDRAGVGKVITPLLNRFCHLNLEVSTSDWLDWALSAGVRPEVVGFIRFKESMLLQFNPASGAKAYPTPRSWEFTSNALASLEKHPARDAVLFDVVKGCVGDGPAAEFVSFVKLMNKLPTPESVLSDPHGSTVPTQMDVLHALTSSLTSHVSDHPDKLGAFLDYAKRLPNEFYAFAVTGVTAAFKGRQATLIKHPGFKEFVKTARERGIMLDVGGADTSKGGVSQDFR
jgi:hypothetical protein